MAKLTLEDITSGFASTTALNRNNDAIEEAMERVLFRDGTSPNHMLGPLDMNGNIIIFNYIANIVGCCCNPRTFPIKSC